MKKIISLLILVLLLSGCAESDFELKKQCSQYIDKYQKEVDEEMEWRRASPDNITVYFDGVYFSKKFDTCVAVKKTINPSIKGIIEYYDTDQIMSYTDALTGEIIKAEDIVKEDTEKMLYSEWIEAVDEAFEFIK